MSFQSIEAGDDFLIEDVGVVNNEGDDISNREVLQYEFVDGKRFNASKMILIKSGTEENHLFSQNTVSKNGLAYRCNFSRNCRARVFIEKNVCFKLIAKAKPHAENHAPPERQNAVTAALTQVKKQCADIKSIVNEQRLHGVKYIFDNVMKK